LTGGSSPVGLYRLLAEDPWRSEVPWDRVHWFIGDERFVAETDPLSNMGAAPIPRSGARHALLNSIRPARRIVSKLPLGIIDKNRQEERKMSEEKDC